MASPDFIIAKGFTEAQRPAAAHHCWQAFRGKLEPLLGPKPRALHFLEGVVNPDFALSATRSDGKLSELAGFKTEPGSFGGGGFRDLARVYGWLGTLWRLPFLVLLERRLAPGVLLMDGIFVSK